MEPLDLGLQLEETHVLITGGAGLIGSVTTCAFLSAGARVTVIDNSDAAISNLSGSIDLAQYPVNAKLSIIKADITFEHDLEASFEKAATQFGPVMCCIALASLDLSYLEHHDSIINMPLDQWKRTLEVNVTGTFLTARTWLRQIVKIPREARKNASLVIVGSESGAFTGRGNADYSCSKSAVQYGLLNSLKADVPHIAPGTRVNAIAPGPVDTAQFRREIAENPDQLWLDAQATTALGNPVSMESVARSILFLASDNFSGHVHGHVLDVNSGKLGNIMWDKGELPNSLEPR